MKKESGFTLIEIIATLVLVGILAVVAGVGIVTAVKGYMLAKNNAVIAGKAQVAMARITRELTELRNTPHPAANPSTFIVFDTVADAVAIGQSGTQIKIAKGDPGTTPDYTGTNSDILVDKVVNPGGLTFAYKKGSADWTSSDDISTLSHVVISLTMSGAGAGGGISVPPFNTTVSPRNNGNFGGAPPPTQSNPPPVYVGRCFVATAAYGNPYHPMVILLKQFRDQYLATWSGGRALIQLYYKEGPYLAEMIHDKPWACGLARVLLLPFVGLSFLLIYARGSIPLVILIMMIGIWLIKRYPVRSIFMKKSIATHNKKGSVLIGLIVTMVIMAVLGAAMVSLISTSGVNQAYGSLSQKAYYLAESGFRYTASEFINVTDAQNNGINENQNKEANYLNNQTLTMTEGSIHLNVKPFHYAASADAAVAATSLSVQFAGGTPAYFAIPSTGSIQIITQTRPNSTSQYTTYTNTYTYTGFSTGTFTGLSSTTPVCSGLCHAVPQWTSVTVLAQPSSTQNNITPNSDATLATNHLTLTRPATGFFMPQYNGEFMIRGDTGKVVYRYVYRDHVNDASTTTTLYGVSMAQRNPDGTEQHTPFNVTTTSYIVPKDFFTVASTGTVGNVSRTITFISPVDIMASAAGSDQKTTSTDSNTSGVNPGDAASHWYAASAGVFSVSNAGGSVGLKPSDTTGQYALKLTDQSTYGTNFFSLMSIKWDSTYANFSGSWYNNDNTLSYDAQVKMSLPQQDHYMAGMVFRLNLSDASPFTNSSWLGVAYMLSTDSGIGASGFSDYVLLGVPFSNIPMIVLWQKPAGQSVQTGTQWIAYKFIAPTITFNGGNGTFTNGSNRYYLKGGTSGASAYITTAGTTDSGVTGELVVSSLFSTFQAGEPLFMLTLQNDVTAQVNQSGGVTLPSTSLPYNNGRDTTTPYVGILANDIIVGRDSGAIARGATVQSGGSWKNWNAKGTMTITETEGTRFNDNEWLDVYRLPSTPVSSGLFVSYDNLTDILTTSTGDYLKVWSTLLLSIAESTAASAPFSGTDVNDIRIYVGDTAAHGTPTGSPLDTFRKANLRWSNPPVMTSSDPPVCDDDVQWPPDADWSTSLSTYLCLDGTYRDHFTLVQGWVINSSYASTFKLTGTTEEPNSTIRTNTFTTNSLVSFTRQEIGLQVSGESMATTGTYFDDFAVRMTGAGAPESTGLSSPLQY